MVCLIDTSNIFFITYSMFIKTMKKNNGPDYEVEEKDLGLFWHMFIKYAMPFLTTYENSVWAFEGHNSTAWRKQMYPLYKENIQEDFYVQMDGQAVYRFATRQVPACIQDALQKASLTVEDIDLFILHQANARIIEAAAKRLHADIQKFPMNVDRMGNMSSATIPVLLDELNREGRLKRGDKLVLSGFGAGLTFGACVIVW